MNKSSTPATPAAAPVRPPDFLLPTGTQGAPRARTGEPEIYLSWGGNIYGPAGPGEVLAGVRTSWFERDALFWFEGQAGWLPVEDFPASFDGGQQTPAAQRTGAVPEETPPLPVAGATPAARTSSGRHRRGERHRKGQAKTPHRHGRSSKFGRLIVFVFVLLAVILTVGLILLLMQF